MNEEKTEQAVVKGSKAKKTPFALLVCGVLFLFFVIVMAANSRKPDYHVLEGLEGKVKGSNFVKMNQALLKDMKENWLPNDFFWPTALLDNMPSLQIGELEVARYNVRVLRDNLSRMRTTDRLDAHADAAFTALSNDPYKWWLPRAESKWKEGYQNLESYYQNLQSGKSHFYPRADNLIELLNQYVSLMGGVNTRLVNAPRDLKQVLSIEGQNKDALPAPAVIDIEIPWRKIDDNFYYAQGVAFALYESFRAIETDFQEVLKDKNCIALVRKIQEILGRCNFEPLIVFNGDPDSIFANHSLNLSSVFNDGRQKINSLIVALMQG